MGRLIAATAMRGARWLLCAGLVLAGVVAPRRAHALKIVAIGDSITQGMTHSGRSGPGGVKAEFDSQGGYPGRLQAELGGQAQIVARGLGGFTTKLWLDVPPAAPAWARERTQLEHAMPGFRPGRSIRADEALIDYVLDVEKPDVVILFVGINDLPENQGKDPDPAKVAARVQALAVKARAKASRRTVLVATLLPNRRDPAWVVAETNRQICALEPRCVRVDEAFAAAGGERLLGDEIHPREEAYAVIADTFATALRKRGLVKDGPAAPGAATHGALPQPTAGAPPGASR